MKYSVGIFDVPTGRGGALLDGTARQPTCGDNHQTRQREFQIQHEAKVVGEMTMRNAFPKDAGCSPHTLVQSRQKEFMRRGAIKDRVQKPFKTDLVK